MNKKLNKLVTNYPVELNEEEIENLSATLAPVIAACGGGGGTGGKIYTGTGFVNVNNTTNQIGLTEDANDKLNKEYVEYNEYSKAIANRYTKTKTNDLLDEKQDTLEFEYDENNKVSAINGSALAGQGGGDVNYSAGIDLKIENNIISVDTNGNPNNTASNTRNFVEGSWTVASGYMNHAEGVATSALGYGVHAQGMWTKFSSSKWSDTKHPEPTDIYWADGAGATVEGYCNATTSCPMSGTIGESDYGPIHGGIIKVIGNGYRQHRLETEPAEYFPSDALIIYRDGCISAAGNISANGIELGAGGGTTYQGRNGVNVDGGYVELTQTAYESVTSIPNISNDVETLKTASGDWNKVSDKLDTTAFSNVSGNFLTAHQSLDEYATKVYANNASANALSEAETWVENQHYLSAVPDEYALKTDIPKTVAQLTDSGNYYQKTDTSSKTEITNALNTKVDKPSSIQTGKLVYDGDTSAWVSLPAGTTTIVQGQGSVTATYDSPNSTYTVSLLSSAEQALAAVDGKVSKPTALTNKYLVLRTDSNGDVSGWCDLKEQCYSKSEAKDTFVETANIDTTLSGNGKSSSTKLGVNTDVIQTKLTDEQLSAIGEVSSKLDRADLDDYVPYSATKLAIGSNNDISVFNSDNSFAQGTNNKVSTSPYSFVQGEANSAVNYYNLAQGYGNYAQDHSLAQGSNNTAISVSFAQGQNCTAESYTFTQGTNNSAVTTSFAQGSANKARYDSFAQGNSNSAFSQSLAQGHYNSADDGSLAQGKHNTAYSHSFAQGSMNYAINNALAQGGDNTAKYFSQALGFGLSIQGSRGHEDGTNYISGGLAIGTYNQTSAGVAFVVGNGHSNGADVEPTRSDAFLIYPDGRVSAAGNISANGGTFTNESVFSAATGAFDNSYIKCINNHSDGYYARFGVGSYGGAVIKAGDTIGTSPIQVNIKPTANNYELVKIERNNSTVGYLIPAVTSTTTAGLTDDGILHIIIES